MSDTSKHPAKAVLEKLKAKTPVSDAELQGLQKHVDELETARAAMRDGHHHDTHGIISPVQQVSRPA